MKPTKNAVVQRAEASEAFFAAVDLKLDAAFQEIQELEPHVAWALGAYKRTAMGSIARFRGSLSKKDVDAIQFELTNMALLVYRCLTGGYRQELARELEGLDVIDG